MNVNLTTFSVHFDIHLHLISIIVRLVKHKTDIYFVPIQLNDFQL